MIPTRRKALKTLLRWCSLAALGLTATTRVSGTAWAALKRKVLSKNTDLTQLVNEIPSLLDPGELALTPVENFEVMGLSDHAVSLDQWRLTVDGAVATPLALGYHEIVAQPAVERAVLLICPGFFAYHGSWKGISISRLLNLAEAAPGSTHVTISGPAGPYEKVERFAISELAADKLFLAHAVNGAALPQKHGFPLRLVAEDHYGSQWVKYVDKIGVQKNEGS